MESIEKIDNFSWQQTMLRIKDPSTSVPFYVNNFGMRLIHSHDFPELHFSIYFLESEKSGADYPSPGTSEAEEYLWNMKGCTIELCHNHGSEKDENFSISNGNDEPHRGFGHLAFNTNNLEKSVTYLEKNGVRFRKKPNEGKMHNIAFALDPDGYWIELVSREDENLYLERFNLSQTMLRVKDPEKSLYFYTKIMGMTLLRTCSYETFTLYFLCIISDDDLQQKYGGDGRKCAKKMWNPVLELTHNHGTEKQVDFHYHNGNDEPQGFGHIGFTCDNVENTIKAMEMHGVEIKKRPDQGKIKGIAFVSDPDGYFIELIPRTLKLTHST